MTEPKPIETRYKGYRFRSRLEARWAVFFDSIGVSFEYEREGFDLGGIWYLPDFYLPNLHYWIEIKGRQPSQEELNKCTKLAAATKEDTFLFYGEAWIPNPACSSGLLFVGSNIKSYRWWTECPFCGLLGIMALGNARHLSCDCVNKKWPNETWALPSFTTSKLVEAYFQARSARFESGPKAPDEWPIEI